jgi:type II secretory pathway component PulF
LGRLLVIGLGLLLLLHLQAIINSLGIEKAWHRLQLKLNIVANWIIKREVNNFLFILALMLESGLSFADALPKAVASIKNSCLRIQFTPTQKMLATGASVTQTLSTVSVINTLILHVFATSELKW